MASAVCPLDLGGLLVSRFDLTQQSFGVEHVRDVRPRLYQDNSYTSPVEFSPSKNKNYLTWYTAYLP